MGFTKIKSNKKTVEPDYGISYNQLPKITHHNFCPYQQAYNQFKSPFNPNQKKSQFDSPLPLTRGCI